MNKKTRNMILVAVAVLIGFSCLAALEIPSLRLLVRGVVVTGVIVAIIAALITSVTANQADEDIPSPPPPKPKDKRSQRGSAGIILILIIVALGLVLAFSSCEIQGVKGNELGVLEDGDGVNNTPRTPRTYYFLTRVTQELYTYDMGQQTLTNTNAEVKSSDNQKVHINYTARWHINPEKIIYVHKTYRTNSADSTERMMRSLVLPEVTRVVNAFATQRHAIDIYSGITREKLRSEIETDLKRKDIELAEKGAVFDSFIINDVMLATEYTTQIEQRQVAIVAASRAQEQQKAAEAEALKAKAEAQADLNRQVVAAERDKQVAILSQQATAEKAVIQAKADAEKQILSAEANAKATIANAEADKQREVLRAVGIQAVGAAEAEAQKLRLQAWAAPGAESFVKVEVAKQIAAAYQNQKGYLPANMGVNLLTDNFIKSVGVVVDGAQK